MNPLMPATSHFVPASLLVGLLAGCTVDARAPVEDGSDRTIAHAAALHSRPSRDLWPFGVVPVCFHPKPAEAVTTPEYAEQTALIRSTLEHWYENVPEAHIDLQGFGLCSDMTVGSLPGQVRIIVSVFGGAGCDEPDPPAGQCNFFVRHCPLGTDPNAVGSCDLPANRNSEAVVFTRGLAYSWPNGFAAGVLHELGHVIARSTEEPNRSDATEPCKRTPSGGPATSDFLTTFDAESTMAATYCHWTPALSPKDELGLEMLYYAGGLDHAVNAMTGLRVGSSILLRADDAVVTDWTFRGAHEQAYPQSIRWSIPPSILGDTMSLPAAWLPADVATTVTATFVDILDREHSASGSVRVNTKLHTAILMHLI
jgi:hypothetical protein